MNVAPRMRRPSRALFDVPAAAVTATDNPQENTMNPRHPCSALRGRSSRLVAQRVIRAIASLALAAGVATAAQAAPVTVTGAFTSFSSWMFDPSVRDSLVNGVALTSSGTVVGSNGSINY